jgi:hypothetical protein
MQPKRLLSYFLGVLFFSSSLLLTTPGLSQVFYQWQDKDGKTHLASDLESVPEEFRAVATKGMFVKVEEPASESNSVPSGPTAAPSTPTDMAPVTYSTAPASKEPTVPASISKNELSILGENHEETGGYIYITGKLQNNYPYPIRYIKVKIKFFDATNGVMFEKSLFVNPVELKPGSQGSYSLVMKSDSRIAAFEREFTWQ